jgi:uncharacterized protein (TIGR02270 family)
MTVEASVLWDVVEEHLDEATFLLQSWRTAVRSPRATLAGLKRTVEPRLLAQLDGLALGGREVAERLLWPLFDKESEAKAPKVAAAAAALLLDPDLALRDRLVETLGTTEVAPVRQGLAEAFELSARADIDEPLRVALYATDAAPAQIALLSVLAARRVDPGPILATLLARPEPDLLEAALRAATAAADRGRCRDRVETSLAHESPAVRAAALRTGLVWSLRAAWQTCLQGARDGLAEPMLFLALLGDKRDLATLIDALRIKERRLAALFALGFSGRVEAVEACLALVTDADPNAAKLAVEAIAAVTGLPLYEPSFVAPPEEEADEPPPLEEDLTIDLTPKPIDELPRPDGAAVTKWWSERRSSFDAGRRYLRGMLLSSQAAELSLAEGPLRRAGVLATEIAIRSGGRVLLPALRVDQPKATVPADLALHREPGWL